MTTTEGQNEGVSNFVTPRYTHYTTVSRSTTTVGPLLPVLLEKAVHYRGLKKCDTLHFMQQIDAVTELITALRGPHSSDILYVVKELGGAWKGKIAGFVKNAKGSVYRQVDALEICGVIEMLPQDHPRVKEALHIEKLKNKHFHPENVREYYVIGELYTDVIDEYFDVAVIQIRKRVLESVQRDLRELNRIRKQAEQMRLEIENNTACATHGCKRPVAIKGMCAMHYQAMRQR